MGFWTPDNLRAATGGTWLVRPPQIELPKDRPADLPMPELHAPITGISTDSRSIQPGQVFIALKGESFDGHAFLAQAAKAGAPILVVSDASGVPDRGFDPACGVLKVDDTAKALLRIAGAYRQSFKRTKVIAVCGSNGKTTTTRLLDQLLSKFMRGSASKKSFNNSIGVPLTICGAKEGDQYLICEVGTNAPGEIAMLGSVVNPDVAIIASIGREHLEKLGDLAGVAAEEAAILRCIRTGGCAVVTADAPELTEHLKGVKNLVTFGVASKADLRASGIRHAAAADGTLGVEFSINQRLKCRVGLLGEHNAMNAMAALAAARRLGIDEQKAAAVLAGCTGESGEMRLQKLDIGGVTIVNDAYNANPDSMIAGIQTVLSLRATGIGSGAAGRTVLVLGEMLEMGEQAVAGHQAVAKEIIAQGHLIDRVVLVGAGMRAAHALLAEAGWDGERGEKVVYFESPADEAIRAAVDMLKPGDLVLVKGSRRVRLERVVSVLTQRAHGLSSGGTASQASGVGRGGGREIALA